MLNIFQKAASKLYLILLILLIKLHHRQILFQQSLRENNNTKNDICTRDISEYNGWKQVGTWYLYLVRRTSVQSCINVTIFQKAASNLTLPDSPDTVDKAASYADFVSTESGEKQQYQE